jgi:hypothetical protein
MWNWLKKNSTRVPALTGAPAVRRQKTYSAQSGYVYQYFYQGMRPISHEGSPATEYVFEVTADRRTAFPLSVILPESAVDPWQREHGRVLTSAERYGLAKMALFQAFDDRPSPEKFSSAVEVRPADVVDITETLDL